MDPKACASAVNSLASYCNNPSLYTIPSKQRKCEWMLFDSNDMKSAKDSLNADLVIKQNKVDIEPIHKNYQYKIPSKDQEALLQYDIIKLSHVIVKLYNDESLTEIKYEYLNEFYNRMHSFLIKSDNEIDHEYASNFFTVLTAMFALNFKSDKSNNDEHILKCIKISKFSKNLNENPKCIRCMKYTAEKCKENILVEEKKFLIFLKKFYDNLKPNTIKKILSYCFEVMYDSKFLLFLNAFSIINEIYSRNSDYRDIIIKEIINSASSFFDSEKSILTSNDRRKISIFTYGLMTLFQSTFNNQNFDIENMVDEFAKFCISLKNYLLYFYSKCSQRNPEYIDIFVKDISTMIKDFNWSVIIVLIKYSMDILTDLLNSNDFKLKILLIDNVFRLLSTLYQFTSEHCSEEIFEDHDNDNLKSYCSSISNDIKINNLMLSELIVMNSIIGKSKNDFHLKFSLNYYIYQLIYCNHNYAHTNGNIKEENIVLTNKLKLFKSMKSSFMNRNDLVNNHISSSRYYSFVVKNQVSSLGILKNIGKIIELIFEPTPTVRLKILRGLLNIIKKDPSVIDKESIYNITKIRMMDPSSLVREVSVELYGLTLFTNQQMNEQSICILLDRLNDIGLSVRKRVLKLLCDNVISINDLKIRSSTIVKTFTMIYDEPTIIALVKEIFQKFFVVPFQNTTIENNDINLFLEMISIVDIEQYDFELILNKLFGEQLMQYRKNFYNLAKQLIITLDSEKNSLSVSSALKYLTKIFPEMFYDDLFLFKNYLMEAKDTDSRFLSNICTILGNILPHVKIIKDEEIKYLQDILINFSTNKGASVISETVYALSSLIVFHSNNFSQIMDIFNKYTNFLEKNNNDSVNKSGLLRAIFTLSQIIRYFGFNILFIDVKNEKRLIDLTIMYISNEISEVSLKAVFLLGVLTCRNPTYLNKEDIKNFYINILNNDSNDKKHMILKSLLNILNDEYYRLKRTETSPDIKELYSKINSSYEVVSIICQTFIPLISEIFDNIELKIRQLILAIIYQTLSLGLVIPNQAINVLIAYSIDSNVEITIQSKSCLELFNSKYPGFIQSQISFGIRKACILRQSIYTTYQNIRGFNNDQTASLNFLYKMTKTSKHQRRNFIDIILKIFTEVETSYETKLFLFDNLVTFSYEWSDEIYFMLYKIIMILTGDFESHIVYLKNMSLESNILDEQLINKTISLLLLKDMTVHLVKKFNITLEELELYSPNNTKNANCKINVPKTEEITFEPFLTDIKNLSLIDLCHKMEEIDSKFTSLLTHPKETKKSPPKKRK